MLENLKKIAINIAIVIAVIFLSLVGMYCHPQYEAVRLLREIRDQEAVRLQELRVK